MYAMRTPIDKFANAALTLMRIAVGWHFLYEGAWKLMQGGKWSCTSFLDGATGPLAGVFQSLAAAPGFTAFGDWAVMLGLTAIGLSLMSGVLARIAAPFGMLLMLMFYSCMPPEPFAKALSAADGHFFIFERNLIEFVALLAITVFPTQVPVAFRDGAWKRLFIAIIPGAVALAIFGGCFWHEYRKGSFRQVEAVTSATVKVHEFSELSALTNKLPANVAIAGVKVSPLVLGGDLIAGHAHARDLIWADTFMRHYHTGGTLERTVRYATYGGVNAAFVEPSYLRAILNAASAVNATMYGFANCATADDARLAKESGATAVYLRPEVADELVRKGDDAALGKAFADIGKAGLPTGFGAENLATVQRAAKLGIKPAFWVVAFHDLNYPAATMTRKCNNIWCADPEKTALFMQALDAPWISIRGLAGGAIAPDNAFAFARKHGVDAVAIDLLEFRIIETINAISTQLKQDVK